MRLFAIADLHLPGGDEKPMDIFGTHWQGHFERISTDWQRRVTAEDVVLIPGDISWAMQLREAVPDLQAIAALPGRKLMIKGNHDYWWSSLSRVRAVLPEGLEVLQHSAADIGPAVVCGTRGWVFPTQSAPLSPEDEKIYQRELARLQLALDAAKRIADGRPILVMLHYPPLYADTRDTAFTAAMEAAGVTLCVYGHLHGSGIYAGYSGLHNGVYYRLTSCDSLGFTLTELTQDIWWKGRE